MARGQIREVASDQEGNVLQDVLVWVYEPGTTTEVDVYANPTGGAPLAQPLETNNQGQINVWVEDGTLIVDLLLNDNGGTASRVATSETVTFAPFTTTTGVAALTEIEVPVGGPTNVEYFEMTNNYVVHDLAADTAEIMSGTHDADADDVTFQVSMAGYSLGRARCSLLLYVGQAAVPGTRLYDSGGVPLAGVEQIFMGSLPTDSPGSIDATKTITIDSGGVDLTWQLLVAIVGDVESQDLLATPRRVGILPNGSKAYVACSTPAKLRVFNLGQGFAQLISGRELFDRFKVDITVGAGPTDVQVTPDGTKVVCTNFTGNSISIIDTATDTLTQTVTGLGTGPWGLAVDNTHAYVFTNDGVGYKVLLAAPYTVTGPVTVETGKSFRAACLANGKVYVCNTTDSDLHILNQSDLSQAHAPLDMGSATHQVAACRADETGKVWAVTSVGNHLYGVDTSSDTVVNDWALPHAAPGDLAIIPTAGQDPHVTPRTAYIGFSGGKFCQFYLSGPFIGEVHSQHSGTFGSGLCMGVAVNDIGEIWFSRETENKLRKFPGARFYCRGAENALVGEFLRVKVSS